MKTSFIARAAAGFGIALCAGGAMAASDCGPPASATQSIALVKNFYLAFNSKNKALLDGVLSPDWIDLPPAPGQGPGLAGMKGAMDHYYASFPDFSATNEEFIVSGNKVVVRSTIRATHSGEFASIKASGKAVQIMAIDIHQLCAGKIVKTWHVEDWLTGLFEMGALPQTK